MKFDKVITVILLLIICLVAVLLVKNSMDSASSSLVGSTMPFSGQPGGDEYSVVNVRTQTVELGEFKKSVRFYGELQQLIEPQYIYADTSGTVKKISVQRGDTVDVGDIVVTVDPSTAGATYLPRTVRTHLKGFVESIEVHVGEQITAQVTPLVKVSNPSDLILSISVPERYHSQLNIGLPAIFGTVAWPDLEFESSVTYIGSTVNSVNRTVALELSVPEDARLKAGMFVQVNLYTEILPDMIIISQQALTTSFGEYFVYVARENRAVRTHVTIGSSSDKEVVILSGLNVGDEIIIAGSVGDGDAIQVIKE